MASKARATRKDSQNPPRPRGKDTRPFTLTPLGFEFVRRLELDEQPGQFIREAEERHGIDNSWLTDAPPSGPDYGEF